MSIPLPPVPLHGAYRPQVMGSNGMVTAGHYLAAAWGARLLADGGNAVDAGVGAGLVLNVVHNDMCSFSGVCPTITYLGSTDKVHTVKGIGPWPKAVTPDYFDKHHGGRLPAGVLRAVVPGAPDAWITTLREFGTMTLAQVLSYPIQLARGGFPVHNFQYKNTQKSVEGYRRYPENARIYLEGDQPRPVGSVLKQPEMADSLEALVRAETAHAGAGRAAALTAARDYYYRGPLAQQTVQYYREQGGLISESDFAEFSAGVDTPISLTYKGYEIKGCGPWSQGPVLLMALGILRHFDLNSLGWGTPAYMHILTEALKLAFADLEAHCGDPDFVDVPMDGLLSDQYLKLRAGLIDPARAWDRVPPYGDPRTMRAVAGELPEVTGEVKPYDGPTEPDTSFVCVMDRFGNAFSATPSDGFSGSPVVPGVGLAVSSRGGQTRLHPWYPNALQPGKRPRLTPNPTLVLKDGKPFMALGTPGNNRQPQAMLQVFLNIVEWGMSPQAAVEAPRFASFSFPATAFPHSYLPGVLRLEETWPEHIRQSLADLGHKVETWPSWHWSAGGVCVVLRDPTTGVFHGGADPRRETYCVAL